MGDLRMPTLGADMTAGTLLEWHVAPGDAVHRGDIVATVDTDKAEIDIETFDDGVVDALVVEPGTRVPVGTVLATLRADGEVPRMAAPVAPEPAVAVPAPPPPAPSAAPVVSAPPVAAAAPAHRRRVSPLARRVAADLGVDLAAVTGTGPAGAITRVDVERATTTVPGTTVPGTTVPGRAAVERRSADERLASLRAAVAALMARSKREIPHYTVQRTIDLTAALDWLDAYNAGQPPARRLLPAALLLRAVALAAHDVPEVNGTYEDDTFHPAPDVTLGVAISLRQGGVIAPAIPNADALALPDLMSDLRELTARARRGVLRGTDLGGATLTVTSLGDQGADLVCGVIFPPQVALVGFGRIAERPVAVNGMLGARRTVIATLAGDHRVSDGHRGSLLLASLDHHLQEPDAL